MEPSLSSRRLFLLLLTALLQNYLWWVEGFRAQIMMSNELNTLNRGQLQALAKANGLKANWKSADIILKLQDMKIDTKRISLIKNNSHSNIDDSTSSGVISTSSNSITDMFSNSMNNTSEKQRKKIQKLEREAFLAERAAYEAAADLTAAIEAVNEAVRRKDEAISLKAEADRRIEKAEEERKTFERYRKRRFDMARRAQSIATRKREAVLCSSSMLIVGSDEESQSQPLQQEQQLLQPVNIATTTGLLLSLPTHTEVFQTAKELVTLARDIAGGTRDLMDRVAENVKKVEK